MTLDTPYKAGDRLVMPPDSVAPDALDSATWPRVRIIRRTNRGRLDRASFVVELLDAPPRFDPLTGQPVRTEIETAGTELYRDEPAILAAVVAWHETLAAWRRSWADERAEAETAAAAIAARWAPIQRRIGDANSAAADAAFQLNPHHRPRLRQIAAIFADTPDPGQARYDPDDDTTKTPERGYR